MSIAPPPLIEDRALRRGIAAWARLTPAEQIRWRPNAVAATWTRIANEALREHGAARIALLDDPARHGLRPLTRLVRELSQLLGFLVPQTHRGNRVSYIRDERADYASPVTRGHQTNAALGFHSDRTDVALLCYVRTAAEGGGLSVVSYDDAARLVRRASPHAYAQLFREFPFDLRDERIFDVPSWYVRPVLWRTPRGVRGHYIRRFIADSQRHPACPRLTASHVAALDALDDVLDGVRAHATFDPSPGEVLLIDNYRVMHARSEFRDSPGAPRLAIRTWIAPFDSEPLPGFLLPIAGSLAAGAFRGGVGRGRRYHAMLGRTR